MKEVNAVPLELVDRLERHRILNRQEFIQLLSALQADATGELLGELNRRGREIALGQFGNKIYTRGLIEVTNYCRNDCYYCGIRRSNRKADRYRLTKEQILECCREGYLLGFRTFVLQGGEDPLWTDDLIVDVVKAIKDGWPDCAITLSLGEKSLASYQKYREAGADRYLLRHETADLEHYRKLHPKELSGAARLHCLRDLKEAGFQVGSGFMVGSPEQTLENLADDLLFLHDLAPEMIGIGPFLPHHDTPFADRQPGDLKLTLGLISILRLMMPDSLIPATTALGTIHPDGREQGILAGANVVMPNLSPVEHRIKYSLYDNKICTGDEAAECRMCLAGRMERIGYQLSVDRGDHSSFQQIAGRPAE